MVKKLNPVGIILSLVFVSAGKAQLPYSRPIIASHSNKDFTDHFASVSYGSALRGMGIGLGSSFQIRKNNHLVFETGLAGGWDSAAFEDHHWKMGYVGAGLSSTSEFSEFNLEIQAGLGYQLNRLFTVDPDDYYLRYSMGHAYGWFQLYMARKFNIVDLGVGFRANGYFRTGSYGLISGNDGLNALNNLKNLSGNAQIEPLAYANFFITEDEGTVLGVQVAGNLQRQNNLLNRTSTPVLWHISLRYAF